MARPSKILLTIFSIGLGAFGTTFIGGAVACVLIFYFLKLFDESKRQE